MLPPGSAALSGDVPRFPRRDLGGLLQPWPFHPLLASAPVASDGKAAGFNPVWSLYAMLPILKFPSGER